MNRLLRGNHHHHAFRLITTTHKILIHLCHFIPSFGTYPVKMFKFIVLLLSCSSVWAHTIPRSTNTTIKICTEKHLPAELQAEADARAIQENPNNAGHRVSGRAPSLALPVGNKWAPGRNLRVKILNGSPKIQQKIRDLAPQWTWYGNLDLTFVSSGDAEIRINNDASGASWSYVGTDNLFISQNEPTMNFGWFTDDTDDVEFSRVILHEFGHALGCIHEHQSPSASGIPWNRDAVYAYYWQTQGWDRQQVDDNIFNLYSADSTQFTSFDPASIMLYAIPAELTTNGFHTDWNTQLSDTDKWFFGQVYQ